MDRLVEADETLSVIVAKLRAGASSPFMHAFNADVGLPLGSKKKKAEAEQQADIADDDWKVVSYHRRAGASATDAEAPAMGVVDRNGRGNGAGLALAGGTQFVLSLLEFETDLSAADIVSTARSAATYLVHEAATEEGAAVGITSGRGSSLSFFGGPQSIATAAAEAKITPDELVDTHNAVFSASMIESLQTLIEELLDALQFRARKDIDLEFPGSFDIRVWLDSGDRPSWVPSHRNEGYKALNERIATADEAAKVDFTKAMTAGAAKKIGPRNRRVEHIVLTSETVSTKDALAFVWHRNREKKNTKNRPNRYSSSS